MLCSVYQLGCIGYREAYQLQTDLVDRRINDGITDTLLLLEHPPTITVGKSGKSENILTSQRELKKRGIPLFFSDRGGDVTYHGLGQLVVYPIISLKNRERDLRRYVYDLEEVVIRALGDFGIVAARDESHRGVWASDKEIAAIGLRVRKWVTMHGIALNVNTDLEPFSLINPCGFTDRGVTSMVALLSRDVPMVEVTERILFHFSQVFSVEIKLLGTDIIGREVFIKSGQNNNVTGNYVDERKATTLV